MAYSADTFVADEQPTTAKWNKLWSNDASFNDGTGIGTGAISSSTKLANAVVTADKLATGAATGYVATDETIGAGTLGSFVAVTTAGPAVTCTIGANGLALVSLSAAMSSTTATANISMGFNISGATTLAASDKYSTEVRQVDANAAGFERQGSVFLMTGLTPGSTTFTSVYKQNATTCHWAERQISVVPL